MGCTSSDYCSDCREIENATDQSIRTISESGEDRIEGAIPCPITRNIGVCRYSIERIENIYENMFKK